MIVVTGATGHLGGTVARALADLRPRLVVRDPARAPELAGCEVRVATYADEEACLRAFDGAEVLFLVSATEAPDRREQHQRAIRAAARAGVGHIVYTSFAAAAPDATFTLARDHADAEAAIHETELPFTVLRDNLYADLLPHFADREGILRAPAGEGRVAAVARADAADVAIAVLREPARHRRATYTLTGPEALTLAELLQRAGRVLGRRLRFENETVDAAYASRRAAYDVEQWQLDAWVSTYIAIADGSLAEVTDDVRRVAGREPRTIEEALAGVGTVPGR